MGKYTAIDDPSAHFQTKIYSGNSVDDTAITNDGNSNLQPDFVWFKRRNSATNHILQDSNRGVTANLESDNTAAEYTAASRIKSFDTDGVTLGTSAGVNGSGYTYVAWQWKANGGTTASNTNGDINSTVQVNSDAVFSIVTYTGNFTATQTVGHGLGVRPDMVIIKNRDTAVDWVVWTKDLTSGNFLKLNSTAAQSSSSRIYQNGFTTSTFGIGANNAVNKSGDGFIAYCFNSVQGYSKFGKYTGNGNADGPFVHTGFKPAFVMIKNIDNSAGQWYMYDIKRDESNVMEQALQAQGNNVEITTSNKLDFVSNGIKHRGSNVTTNQSGSTHIYMAFAENPFVTSTGIMGTAR